MSEILPSPIQPAVQAFGSLRPRGTYVLAIGVVEDLSVRFGQFAGGRRITVPAGYYLYVGSAMGRRGATSLPWRLLRHAIRGIDKPPHLVWSELVPYLTRLGLSEDKLNPDRNKTLRWNVDHLLDRPEAHLLGTLIFCSDARLETRIAQRLESDKAVRPLARGLGAHDSPGATHLLRAEGEPQWWHMLPGRLAVEVGVVRRKNLTDPKFARQS